MLRPDTIKLLEENIGGTLDDINHILFDPTPKEMEIKTKINKWDLMKLKSFCTAKETINKTKRQPSEWEKIFANEATDKGLISKMPFTVPTIQSKNAGKSLYKILFAVFLLVNDQKQPKCPAIGKLLKTNYAIFPLDGQLYS